MSLDIYSRILWATGILILTLLLRFFYRGYCIRKLIHNRHGPPHSWIFGHLASTGRVIAKMPRDAAPQTFMPYIKDEYDLGEYFYMDSWPLGPPILVVFNHKMMEEFTVTNNLPKHELINDFMRWFGGEGNLVTSEGAQWRRWRGAFNPGFSASHLMTNMAPMIVEKASIFSHILNEHAKKGDLFRMESASMNLTVDVIGKAVLDLDFNAQKEQHELVNLFRRQTMWMYFGSQYQVSELWDIRRPLILRWTKWKMNRYIGRLLDERFATRKSREKSKYIVDLALETYLREVKKMGGDDASEKVTTLPKEFRTAAISNTILFIFAGHDTTSSVISYSYYYLSRHPDVMAKIRKEHEEVFGPDVSTTGDQIKKDVYLVNKLEYTTAVIREILRLQGPASTIRKGQKDFFLHDPDTGEPLPTDGFMLWPVVTGIHRNEKLWNDAATFRPERHLKAEAKGNTDAWIPFSKGLHNCIGQELAMIEVRIVLAMTCRSWDFQEAFDELDMLKSDGSGFASDNTGIREQFGEKAYQIQMGTARPRAGMPCRLKIR